MASQDTLDMAQSEEENARVVQSEIDKLQANNAALQRDIDTNNQVIAGLQSRAQEYTAKAQDLRKQAMDEQQKEQEQMREQQENQDGIAKEVAKESINRGLFG